MADIRVENETRKRPPRVNQVLVRFTDEGAEIMDRLRGDKTRQEYIRELVAQDYVRARKAGRL